MELMHKSLAWETEKATLGLKKLNEWFLDDVEEERAVLRSFAEGRRGFAVTNFRVAKLSDALRQDIHLVRNPPKEDEMPELRRSRSVSIKSRPSKNMSEATEEPEEENPFATGHKQELRRQRRKAREAEWRAFNATKPDEQYENPDDVAAIEVARNTLGDFKLKSAPDYVVPEEDSMNYRRKREQMLLLEEAIHDAKVDFNAEFAALRDVRARVVEQVQAVCARIAEITVELDDADRPEGIEALTAVAEPFRSTPLADEYPKESRETVTDVQLAAFDAKRKRKPRPRRPRRRPRLAAASEAAAARRRRTRRRSRRRRTAWRRRRIESLPRWRRRRRRRTPPRILARPPPPRARPRHWRCPRRRRARFDTDTSARGSWRFVATWCVDSTTRSRRCVGANRLWRASSRRRR